MIQRFLIIIFLFLFADNIYSFQEEEIYEKYSSDFSEINQEIFQKQLLNVLSYNIDLVIDVQERTFSAEALINLLITGKSIQDTFYFSLDSNFSVNKIECDNFTEIKLEVERDFNKSHIYKFYFPFSELKNSGRSEIRIKLNYAGKIWTRDNDDFLEFGANINWYPFINSRSDFRYLLNIGIDGKYSIISPAEIIRKIRKDKKEYYTLQYNKPVSQIIFIAVKGLEKKKRNYKDGAVITVYYKKLPSIEVNRTFIELDWILGFYFDRFLRIIKEKRITAVFLPRNGKFYTYSPSFFVIPEKEITDELTDWKDYRAVFNQICSKIAHYWWENCTIDWLKEGLCGYFSTFAVETMFGYDEVMKNMDFSEKKIINFSKDLSASSNDLTFIDKEIVFRYKLPFVIRMLSFYISGAKFKNMIKELTEYTSSNDLDENYFQKTAEKSYGSTLKWFFNQWIDGSDIPRIKFNYTSEAMSDGGYKLLMNLEQICKNNYIISGLFEIYFEDDVEYRKIMFAKKKMTFTLIYMKKPIEVKFDTENYILNK